LPGIARTGRRRTGRDARAGRPTSARRRRCGHATTTGIDRRDDDRIVGAPARRPRHHRREHGREHHGHDQPEADPDSRLTVQGIDRREPPDGGKAAEPPWPAKLLQVRRMGDPGKVSGTDAADSSDPQEPGQAIEPAHR
jgi:hypothetical protein